MKVLMKAFFEKQQKGEGTDCSFVFNVPAANGKTSTEKVIHAHKFILSAVSPYFETNFKAEWKGDEPIRVTTFKHSVFEQLLKVVYMNILSFETLDHALDLYEAAHFYQMQEVLDLLRDKIPQFWFANQTIKISKFLNATFKYQDWILVQFATKCFTVNASKILVDYDWLNFTPDVINYLYPFYDTTARSVRETC